LFLVALGGGGLFLGEFLGGGDFAVTCAFALGGGGFLVALGGGLFTGGGGTWAWVGGGDLGLGGGGDLGLGGGGDLALGVGRFWRRGVRGGIWEGVTWVGLVLAWDLGFGGGSGGGELGGTGRGRLGLDGAGLGLGPGERAIWQRHTSQVTHVQCTET